jgi:hypothetical protein
VQSLPAGAPVLVATDPAQAPLCHLLGCFALLNLPNTDNKTLQSTIHLTEGKQSFGKNFFLSFIFSEMLQCMQ